MAALRWVGNVGIIKRGYNSLGGNKINEVQLLRP